MVLLISLVGVAVGLAKKGIGFNVIVGATLVSVVWVGGVLGYGKGLPLVPLIAPTLALALSLWTDGYAHR
jgi:hypothetical protein